MNILLVSFLPQNEEKIKNLSGENQRLIVALNDESEENYNKQELLKKSQSIINELKDRCSNCIELDQYESSIYNYFVLYITRLTNIDLIRKHMWDPFLAQKEVNTVSNSIREVVQRVGEEEIFEHFIDFTCVELEIDVVKNTLSKIFSIFTKANNNNEVMSVVLSV